MKCSMRRQEKVTFQYRWLLNRGDCKDRFDCTFLLLVFQKTIFKNFSIETYVKIWIPRVLTSKYSGVVILKRLNLLIILMIVHIIHLGPSWLWSYGSWIYNYLVQSVPITTNVVISNLVHCKVYSIQHYVIKVSDLRQVVVFLQVLRFPPLIKLTAKSWKWN